MRRVLLALLIAGLGVFCALSPVARAGTPPDDALAWLARITTASQRLNYVGTFSYQVGQRSETSRIVHRFSHGLESERLEVLDGSPREVLRRGGELRCILPEQRTVIVSRVEDRRTLPGRLPQDFASLVNNYRVRIGEVTRVADHDARVVIIEPLDDLRFGHVLWAEVRSGLLLKSRLLAPGGAVVEQFSFSDVQIGEEIDDRLLAPRAQPGPGWRVVEAVRRPGVQVERYWRLKMPLPGFTLVSVAYRVREQGGNVTHMVFSDGLASISVFIEPVDDRREAGRTGASSSGVVSVYERVVGDQRLTVLGEVPAQAVAQLAAAIELGRGHE
ncbi:siderophore-interacting protein [Betaproteobacteria bacterium]|nr:siderophore-interacting protein [Betaproteobacteria bacterium]GHU11189.1 siderophore-interacting protein [Betaproteobacteria bacterium]GHU25094.1 siderophore-interacting protein [Betaproteobacteria bacterium]GHU31634.1 siderophore-interacting protein [Betaproteobacteria bacterium]